MSILFLLQKEVDVENVSPSAATPSAGGDDKDQQQQQQQQQQPQQQTPPPHVGPSPMPMPQATPIFQALMLHFLDTQAPVVGKCSVLLTLPSKDNILYL